MSDGGMILHWVTAAVIAAAVLLGAARLLLWRRASRADAPLWRLGALVGLQMTAAVLLYLTLNPPATVVGAAALRVVMPGQVKPRRARGKSRSPCRSPMPWTSSPSPIWRQPCVVSPRRSPSACRATVCLPGIRASCPFHWSMSPGPAPAGARRTFLALSGRARRRLRGGRAGRDPRGRGRRAGRSRRRGRRPSTRGIRRSVPARRLHTGGRTNPVPPAPARRPGRSGGGRSPFPSKRGTPPAVRMMVLAGAPIPEVRQIRRWAESVELDVSLQVDLGAGLRLGDAAPLTAAGLSEVDLLVIDDRRWETLPGASRAAVASAVRSGMGLLLRPTGPLGGETRRQWAALGVSLSGTGDAVAPPDESEALTRLDLTHGGSAAVPHPARRSGGGHGQLVRPGTRPRGRDHRGRHLRLGPDRRTGSAQPHLGRRRLRPRTRR